MLLPTSQPRHHEPMIRYVIAAVFLVSTLAMTGVAVAQRRGGRLRRSSLALVVSSATSTLVVAGALIAA